MRYNEAKNKINLHKESIINLDCSVCKEKKSLNFENGGIITYRTKEIFGSAEHKSRGLFKSDHYRQGFKVCIEYVLVCPNCGFEKVIGYKETNEIVYTPWSEVLISDWDLV